jgi:hypothetical protein
MGRRTVLGLSAAVLLLFSALWLCSRASGLQGLTWLDLTDAGSGRLIFAGPLEHDRKIVLTWKNSLFGLMVTEVFAARQGRLELTEVTFADPHGPPPPDVRAEDLDDLYHTGGPFHVNGLARPLTHAVFRIGEIGDPRLTISGHLVHLKQEVGFGGAVVLDVRRPRLMGSFAEAWAFLQNLPGCRQ